MVSDRKEAPEGLENLMSRKEQQNREEAVQQYVIFQVGGESYGVSILSVREIRPWQDPTPLPDAPSDVRGMIDLRGVVVPIYDFKHHLTGGPSDVVASTVVIITQVNENQQERYIGMFVDSVSDIVSVKLADIKPTPMVENTPDRKKSVIGVVSIDDKMITLIDLDAFFNLETVPG